MLDETLWRLACKACKVHFVLFRAPVKAGHHENTFYILRVGLVQRWEVWVSVKLMLLNAFHSTLPFSIPLESSQANQYSSSKIFICLLTLLLPPLLAVSSSFRRKLVAHLLPTWELTTSSLDLTEWQTLHNKRACTLFLWRKHGFWSSNATLLAKMKSRLLRRSESRKVQKEKPFFEFLLPFSSWQGGSYHTNLHIFLKTQPSL